MPEGLLVFYLDTELSTINDNFYFDPYDGKWSFDVNLYILNQIYKNQDVFIIDLIYNGENSTATCRYKSEKKCVCIPDIEIQKNTDIFSISPEKNKGTVTLFNTMIISYARLELDLAYDLKITFRSKKKLSFCLQASIFLFQEHNQYHPEIISLPLQAISLSQLSYDFQNHFLQP